MTNLLIRRCPECGDKTHLYADKEVRWDGEAEQWVATDCGEDFEVECTDCDWKGLESEADPEADVDPDQWPGGDLTGHPGYAEQPLDTPSLDTSFHDREMEFDVDSIVDWRFEVANGDTRLGFDAWREVQSAIRAEGERLSFEAEC